MLGRNNENGPLLPGSRASAPFALPQGRNLPSNCRTVLESLAHFDLSSTSSSSSSLHSFNCVAIAVIDDSQLVIYCGTNSGDLLLLTINPNCDRSLSATVDDADDGRLKVVRCVNISRSAVNSIHVVNQISRILVLSDGFLYLVDLQLLQPVKKLGILKGVNIVARRVCSTESGNSNWILEDGVSSSGSTVGGRLMKKLGGGVRSNRARVKEFSSRGVDNDGACLFVVAMGKKVLFIELNSGSSKHDREVDGQRGLFVILKEMPCIDGVKTMAWLDDSLILGTDSAYSLMSCITGHVNLIFSLPDTAAIPCLKLLSKDKKVLLLVDNAGIIVDRHGQPVGGTLVFGCAPCSIAELSSYVVVACNGKMEIYHKISGNCVQALSFKGNVGTSNCFVADEEDVNGRFVVFATSSKVFCYRKIPSEEQIKDLLRKKNYKEAISLVEELEVDGDLSREMVSFVHAQVGFLLLFDLRFEEAIEHFLLSETMEPSEIFPFVIRDPNRWSLLVPRNRYWGLHPPPVHVEDVVEDGLLAIQRAAFLKKAGVESAVDNEFLLNPPTRADLLDSAFRNLIRYLLVMRHKDLIQPVKEGVDTVLMYLYRILNCTEDMENLASSENSCVVEELESLLEESGHLRTLAFLYVNKGMSSNALAIWRVLARNYPLGTHQDVADSYNVSDSNSIPVSSRETALMATASSSSSSRFLSSSSYLHSCPPPSLTSSFPHSLRVNFRLKRVSNGAVVRNVAFPRAYISSSTATESSQENMASKSYGSDQIQVLQGLDPVRKRPGMYIGSTGSRGLHHLVYEILDNAVDEAQAGYASKIDVILYADNSVSITDNGRGIPTDVHPVTKKSSLETVLTVLHAGGKFGGSSSGYSVSGGLHGVGLSVVNALSAALEITVWRDGMEYKQKYARGKPVTNLSCHVLPPDSEDRNGTSVRFWPDKEVFTTEIEFDYDTIAGRIRELAFLNPKLTIAFSKESEDPEKSRYNEYYYAGGLVEYVKWLNVDKRPIHDVVGFHREIDGVTIDAALQWCSDAYSDTILGYANSIRTVDGGTHIDGFKTSLTRTLNSLAKKSKANKDKDLTLSGEHVREGLTCVISVKVPNPEFEGQTKTRLGNPEVRKVVDQCVQDYLVEYLELHPDVLDSIVSKALNALKAALAAKRARELVRQKSVLKSSSLPGKLADCSATNPEEAEIFIVEGDSAGGSAKQGRDRRFQAILPLRGKILNVERRDDAAMYKNEEIQNLILGLGLGVKGEDFKMEDLRYHKIIILTDADVDGAHIRTLLLTFFYRYQKDLFDAGCIYVGVPPLYKVERGKQFYYCYSEAELKKLQSTFPSNASYNIQRFKGLGEMMPAQLWETTMDPESRLLKQLTVEDAAQANLVFASLMGARVDGRKELIRNAANIIDLEQLDI